MTVDTIQLKRQAAAYAADLVQSGMIVGLGHGSTAIHAVAILAEQLKAGRLKDVIGVPSSYQVEEEAMRCGMPLRAFDEIPVIDITIDGADEVDPQLKAVTCPYPDLADRDRTICAMERQLLTQLLGTRLMQRECRLDGDACCSFEPEVVEAPQGNSGATAGG